MSDVTAQTLQQTSISPWTDSSETLSGRMVCMYDIPNNSEKQGFLRINFLNSAFFPPPEGALVWNKNQKACIIIATAYSPFNTGMPSRQVSPLPFF